MYRDAVLGIAVQSTKLTNVGIILEALNTGFRDHPKNGSRQVYPDYPIRVFSSQFRTRFMHTTTNPTIDLNQTGLNLAKGKPITTVTTIVSTATLYHTAVITTRTVADLT